MRTLLHDPPDAKFHIAKQTNGLVAEVESKTEFTIVTFWDAVFRVY
jgi:hypothetical protein